MTVVAKFEIHYSQFLDESGKAVVLFDGDNPHTLNRPNRTNTSRLLWVTGESPADISGPADRAALALGKIGISPPPGGSVFRIVDFPPLGPQRRFDLFAYVGRLHAPEWDRRAELFGLSRSRAPQPLPPRAHVRCNDQSPPCRRT